MLKFWAVWLRIIYRFPCGIVLEYIQNHTIHYYLDAISKGININEWNTTNKFISILGISLGMRYLFSVIIT